MGEVNITRREKGGLILQEGKGEANITGRQKEESNITGRERVGANITGRERMEANITGKERGRQILQGGIGVGEANIIERQKG